MSTGTSVYSEANFNSVGGSEGQRRDYRLFAQEVEAIEAGYNVNSGIGVWSLSFMCDDAKSEIILRDRVIYANPAAALCAPEKPPTKIKPRSHAFNLTISA